VLIPAAVSRELGHPERPAPVSVWIEAARAHGLEVTGTIGVLRAAAKKGHLNAAQAVRALKTPPFAPRQACIGGCFNKEQD
jgi:hypothetical protein